MDRLPLEMWTAICSHACLDGGITGCALSVTSHYLRDAVLPVQLQSVAINDVKHAVRFLKTLKARPPKHRRILYLFLSNDRHGWRQLRSILQDILTLVAPDLRMLTDIIIPGGSRPHSLPNVPFPALEELTIYDTGIDPASLDQLSFPSLKFLHCISRRDGVEMYTSRAPVLTHLRLSGIIYVSNAMHNTLYRLLRAGDHNGDHDGDVPDPTTDDRPIIPSSLERIIIEHESRLLPFRIAADGLWALYALRNADTKGKIVVLLPQADHAARYAWNGVRERSDWDERLAGGEGCWRVPPELDAYRQGKNLRESLRFLGF